MLVLAAALVVVFHRLLLGETFVWGLPSLQFYPWREYAFDVLRSGHLPYWNPYSGAGAPLLANYQSALLYPFNWFGLFLPLAWSMSVTAVLHLFIAGWGMWAFTGQLGVPAVGRGMSALAFAFTGYLVARLGTYPTVFTAAWMPWMMWAVLKIMGDTRRQYIGWLAVFTALQLLAGHAQTTWYSMLLVGLFSAYWGVTHRVRWQRMAVLALAVVLGAGVASAQLLPTAELLAQSQRSSGVDYEKTMNFSYQPQRTMNFFSANVFGTPGDGSYSTPGGAFFEDAVYIGFTPLLSAFAAIITWAWGKLRRHNRPAFFATVPFWLVIVVVAFVLALGRYSPLFPFLYEHIPTFSMFQAPVRWHIWTVFGLSVLAGIGTGMWTRGHWVLFGTRLATAAGIGAALLALVAFPFLPPELVQNRAIAPLILAVVVTGTLGAAAGVLTLAQPQDKSSSRYPWWMLAVWIVIAVDLSYAAWGLNPTAPSSFYDPIENTTAATVRAYWPDRIETNLKFEDGGYLQFYDYRITLNRLADYRASELPNLNMLDRIPLLNNFEPLLIGSFMRYTTLVERYPAQRDNLLGAAGVGYVYDEQGQRVELNAAAQRAWFVDTACWHNDREGVEQALIDNWDAGSVVHLLGEGDCAVSAADVQTNSVESLTDNANSLVLNTTVDHDSWLVLADSYYPGWSAQVDGQPAGIVPANGMFRAVRVPAGAAEVRFDYQFRWFWPSVLASIVSIFIVVVLFRSREPQPTSLT